MSTTIWFPNTTIPVSARWSSGNNDAKLNGSTSGWGQRAISPSQPGTAEALAMSTSTVAGPTNGVEAVSGSVPREWISPPLDADYTIGSGSITFNVWASESSMSANVAVNCIIEKIDGATGAFTTIHQTARVTELGTVEAAANWSETPGAGTACKKGDRLRVRFFGDDAGTMASGFSFLVRTGVDTVGGTGDTWVQFTETFGFITTDPTGTTLYPTDTASDINPGAALERYLSPSRGAGVQTDVTNTAAGWTAPIQMTDTAGGTVVEWYSKPLDAFTLGGVVLVNGRLSSTFGSDISSFYCEIAVCNGDGSSPVVWGRNIRPDGLPFGEAAEQLYVSGDDVSVTAGQRLRVRFYIDDTVDSAMVGSQTATLYYAGTSGGASGDTYLTFTQTITEQVTLTAAQEAGLLQPASPDEQITDWP